MNEFELIRRYFTRVYSEPTLGVGDDCAILTPTDSALSLATSTDLLVEGRHFFSNVDPYRLGHKALAVNLSDLAAMGARPAGCLLGLALPELDEDWLAAFSAGFHALSQKYHCPLIGGDTTKSPSGITLSVTVMGWVRSPFLTRSAAKVGDEIWVSGELGAASVALQILQGNPDYPAALLALARDALECPEPQVELGLKLANYAHALIDISDGLSQDLGHILTASQVGAQLYSEALPRPEYFASLTRDQQLRAILNGGDDYQLCATAPISVHAQMRALGMHKIGEIKPLDYGYRLDQQGLEPKGFQHF